MTSVIRQFAQQNNGIQIDANSVSVIEGPQEFYQTLLTCIRGSSKRITLSTLYIGDGELEKHLIDEIHIRQKACGQLRVNILLDYLRGTRGLTSGTSSVTVLQKLLPSSSVHLYHTPNLRGVLKQLLPERVNEIVGLQHLKLYIFDDDVIISGANLSDSYFTNRQDRYIIIKNTPELAEFCCSLIDAVSSCSFLLKSDNTLETDPRCSIHPFKGNLHEYKELVHQRVKSVLSRLNVNEQKCFVNKHGDTVVYPLVQMGLFDVNMEYDFLKELFASQEHCLSITLTSGYFNFTEEYGKLITHSGNYPMNIIYASPQANGFHKGSGFSRYIPSIYVVISEFFYRSTRSGVRLFEYERPGWTYHAKGLWIDSNASSLFASLVGSSNYGYRSVHRDLEMSMLLVTSNEKLKKELRLEHARLKEWTFPVQFATFLRPDHRVPLWIKLVSKYIRNFF
ncbi:hypothetical protein AB6A40_006006 [Gnathostoma spinigerum]|uniref:CDP-diacylglycerol--glycerol-3-phosphate 3-phosphatidyltransferase n=1 Tax=Gnathostoma spinigerum TaxID=75299 RepID=A0ABD6ERW9_9BILA